MSDVPSTRRDFLRLGAAAGLGAALGQSRHTNVTAERIATRSAAAASGTDIAAVAARQNADVTIRIAPVLVELAPHRIISTIGYNGSVPAPIIRLHEGRAVTVELINDTDTPELVHWHGQLVPSDIDGAAEEGTPPVPPHGTRHYTLTPRPAGTRWVHTHTFSGPDLHRGMYTGQFGVVYVEPANEPGRYDREVFLATHEWEPFFGAEEMNTAAAIWPQGTLRPPPSASAKPNGYEIGYRAFSINGKSLGHGEPVRVKRGERVMFRILNASATENIQLALAGHEFEVVALDGNPVPTPRRVQVLALGVAERIDALVTMNNPGVWILGTPHDDDRHDGMGIVVEYAGAKGAPRWIAPHTAPWDYTSFGASRTAPAPDETIPMVFGKINGGAHDFNRWTVNGQQYDQSRPIAIHSGRRYRLAFQNLSDDPHPVHLHRHLFEVVRVNGRATSGVMKDTIVVPGFGAVDVDVVADDPGDTLFHCHQTLHMDYGFMRLFRYV
ncbi:MAG TPA: multicopper oxidase domain-containing protein [Gemmatimonadaceae bacterium]|nr:multicopper oxidase domain-containing protein [Gemmatimonadaceae bacterium]